MKKKIIFVCLGNICRSPLARALFEQHIREGNMEHLFTVDSAGTSGHHAGEDADPRTLRNARQNGLNMRHRARKFESADLELFDHVIVMDRQNLRDVLAHDRSGEHAAKVRLMRDWDPDEPGADVPDPWYGGEEGFQEVYEILHRSTSRMLRELQA